MKTGFSTEAALLLVLAVAFAAPYGVAEESATVACVPAGREDKLTDLITAPGFFIELEGGLMFTRIRTERDEIRYTLTVATEDDEAPALAHVVLRPRTRAQPGDVLSASFAVQREVLADEPAVRSAINAAVASIVARDEGDIYEVCRAPEPPLRTEPPEVTESPSSRPEDGSLDPGGRSGGLGPAMILVLLFSSAAWCLFALRAPDSAAPTRSPRD